MGKIKLLLLSVLFVGQFAFACGSTITGGGPGSTEQTNTSSQCPSNTPSSYPGGSAPAGGPRGGPSSADMAAKAKAEREGCIRGATAQMETDVEDCKAEVDYKAMLEKRNCNSTGGAVAWSFSYSGLSFGLSIDLAPVDYSFNSTGAWDCEKIVDASVELTKSKCKTTGETMVKNACARYN